MDRSPKNPASGADSFPAEAAIAALGFLADDPDRLVLKVQADIFIGSVWAELEKVSFREQ